MADWADSATPSVRTRLCSSAATNCLVGLMACSPSPSLSKRGAFRRSLCRSTFVFCDLQFLRPGAVRLVMCDGEMAVDAGLAFGLALGVPVLGLLRLQFGAHGGVLVAIPAFQRVGFLHTLPYPLGKLVALRLELLLCVDHTGEIAPRLQSPPFLEKTPPPRPARQGTVPTVGAHAAAVLVVDGVLKLRVDVGAHLVAADT